MYMSAVGLIHPHDHRLNPLAPVASGQRRVGAACRKAPLPLRRVSEERAMLDDSSQTAQFGGCYFGACREQMGTFEARRRGRGGKAR